MEVQPIGDGCLYIHLKDEDLSAMQSAPEQLTDREVRRILIEAVGESGEDWWHHAFLELYPGHGSALIFARLHPDEPECFVFEELEPLLQAAEQSPGGLVSYLIYFENAYYLTVYPWAEERGLSVLSEFGTALAVTPHLALHFMEHGTILAGPMALDTLKKFF